MFSKRCFKCENKIGRDSNFCPSCGFDLKGKYEQEDYGMLGKNDISLEEDKRSPDNFMEKIFNSAMRVLEKQMQNLNNEINDPNKKKYQSNPRLNVQFFVNGQKVLNDNANQIQQPVKIINNMSKDKLKKFSELPKTEPKSRIKRLSDKIIYELIVPAVDSINDVLINQLESSIEVKALSKDVVYSKNLNINLPILRYQLIKDNLVIEMQTKQ